MTIPGNRRLWIAAWVVLTGLGMAVPQLTLGQVPRFQPSRPTLSPFLNMSRGNIGGVPNYFSLVRPLTQQRAINQQQGALIANQQVMLQRKEREIQQLQNDVQRGLVAPSATGSTSWFLVPGREQRFQDTTGYFPQPIITRR